MYGYEITRKVETLTEGKIRLTYGALYPVLHKLENEGVLVTETENFNNRIRIYYSLTEKGHSVVAEKITGDENVHRFSPEHCQSATRTEPCLS